MNWKYGTRKTARWGQPQSVVAQREGTCGRVCSERVTLPQIKVSSREKGDLVMLGIGGFTPLDGFMTHADWQGVCAGMKMANGLFWPIPITLSTDKAHRQRYRDRRARSRWSIRKTASILATMKVTEKYTIDKAHECATVFKTTDIEHPGVKMVMAQGDVNLAGPVKVLSQGGFDREIRRAVHDAAPDPRAVRADGLVQESPRSRRATRCTARMNTWPRSPSRSATAC